jgi:hypothetical protein
LREGRSIPVATIQEKDQAGIVTRDAAADWLAVGVGVVTTWWYVRVSRGHSFAFDDWQVAVRPTSVGDLFEPYNGHLSVVPLAIYRGLLGTFGLETFMPYRLLGISSLLALGVALFVFARSRVGAPLGLVVAVSVLWLPTTTLTPFLANFHLALVCAVLCASSMPSVDLRSDVVVGVALVVALATSGVGVAVAAACAVHAVSFRPRPRRWIAVGVPSLLWLSWWRTLGDQTRIADPPSVASAVADVVQGGLGSFGALTVGWEGGGLILAAGWLSLLVWRTGHDRVSARTQLAWTAGLVVWWIGVVWSRPGAVDTSNTARYEYVGAVLILLSALPAVPREWLRATRARWEMTVPALLIVAAIVVVNHDELRQAAFNRGANGTKAERVLYELEQTVEPVEPTRRLILQLAAITVQDYYGKVVARYGSPLDRDVTPDEALIERRAVWVAVAGPVPEGDPACVDGPVTERPDAKVALHTGDQPAVVRARRFGSSMVDVTTVRANRSAVVGVQGPTIVDVPWVIDVVGGCLHEG